MTSPLSPASMAASPPRTSASPPSEFTNPVNKRYSSGVTVNVKDQQQRNGDDRGSGNNGSEMQVGGGGQPMSPPASSSQAPSYPAVLNKEARPSSMNRGKIPPPVPPRTPKRNNNGGGTLGSAADNKGGSRSNYDRSLMYYSGYGESRFESTPSRNNARSTVNRKNYSRREYGARIDVISYV